MASQREPNDEAIFDEELQYNPANETERRQKYPRLPHNHSKTLPFHDLLGSLFNPLNDLKKHPTGPKVARAKKGRNGQQAITPHQQRRNVIERFISRWRKEVGNDFYPALRLILPDKDRDRAMYGLKEKAIGKLIVKVLKINPKSEDGESLLNWKLPGQSVAARMAGDFPGRCYEVLSKRAMRTEFGEMRIAEVNAQLDKLSTVSKEEDQLPIFEDFYNRMNASELLWLIRIILRQTKVGASEKTILEIWHEDGEALFNVTSSLRRVCWDLWDPDISLTEGDRGVCLMSCFQPQLAQFQKHSFDKMIAKLGCTSAEPDFWIEEKLDGERMQLHMMEDEGVRKFGYWSRNGKDYTYLYGERIDDDTSSLTRFFKAAFDPKVRNIVLDGEMITWDPVTDSMVGFGSLKTAALSEGRNPFSETGHRPMFRVFDCVYLNDTDLTQFILRDRRKALEKSVTSVHRRIEIHEYIVATKTEEVETELRKVIADAGEGLVLKNPRSAYQLNSRNDDWMKVKPEYMEEFGESLDCVIVGGYYGQGHRGGMLASFLCGLRVDKNEIDAGANPMKCYSFFKVGGGFRANDYALIKEKTNGKWMKWDRKRPPTEYIQLGGDKQQHERPDEWIKPCDSVVVEVKAASVGASDQFATKFTLRFPRFKKIRTDKVWKDALSAEEFVELKIKAESESKKKALKVDSGRKVTKRLKKELIIAGNDSKMKEKYAGPETKLFAGITFCVMREMVQPKRQSKAEIEQIIKSNGGSISQSPAGEDVICVSDKKVVKVASLIKSGHTNVVKPAWILDAVKQAEIDGPARQRLLVPFEPGHMFHMLDEMRPGFESNIDEYGDSYARDVTVEDLKRITDDMIHPKYGTFSRRDFLSQLEERGKGLGEMTGSMFSRCVVRFKSKDNTDFRILKNQFLFAGGMVAETDEDEQITHFVLGEGETVGGIREMISRSGRKVPRIVSMKWLSESWEEKTVLDEERYIVS